ncbi:DedA family protein [Candidatus Dojkabacteria bacterium]|nr:DedA family protein [Candidatus Dojkabacteria bacterium]
MIHDLITWLTGLIETIGYPGVALSMFIESFFAPIPSELILPFAGFLASEGKMNILALGLIGGIFSYLGTLPFYFIGTIGNRETIDKFIKKYGKYLFISEDEVNAAFKMFDKFGKLLIFFGRLVPLVRSVISFPAGMAKMNFAGFTVLTLIGSTMWSYILVIAGYFLGEHWDAVGNFVGRYEKIVMVLVALAGVIYIGKKIFDFIQLSKKEKSA